jgi:hypothetical protein
MSLHVTVFSLLFATSAANMVLTFFNIFCLFSSESPQFLRAKNYGNTVPTQAQLAANTILQGLSVRFDDTVKYGHCLPKK